MAPCRPGLINAEGLGENEKLGEFLPMCTCERIGEAPGNGEGHEEELSDMWGTGSGQQQHEHVLKKRCFSRRVTSGNHAEDLD